MVIALFGEPNVGSFLILVAVIGFLGEGVTHLTERMAVLRRSIRAWAVGLGIVTGLLFFVTAFSPSTRGRLSPDDVLSQILRSGLVGACAGFVWYLFVAVLTFVYQHVIAPPFRVLWRWLSSTNSRSTHGYDENRRNQDRLDREAALTQAKSEQADAQNRRAGARATCELLYHRYAHALGDRFPKSALDDFLTKYMGDNHPSEQVEERGHQLQALILQHVNQIEPPKTPYTLKSLADWYRQTKDQIEGLPVDDRYKQSQLALLNARYAELQQALMETLQP